MAAKKAYVVGTADTKGPELNYVKSLIEAAGVDATLVNVGTKGGEENVDVTAALVAASHAPNGQGWLDWFGMAKRVGRPRLRANRAVYFY